MAQYAVRMGRRRYQYDCFISYNSKDSVEAQRLAFRLEDAGLRVFLDLWHAIRGAPAQETLESGLAECRACVVLVGPNGIGPWENLEIRAALARRVRLQSPHVVPVLLPGTPDDVGNSLPDFLGGLTRVDFARGDDDSEFRALVAAVKGKAPGRPSMPAWASQVAIPNLVAPTGIAIDGDFVFVADHTNGTVTRVDGRGTHRVLLDGLNRPHHLAVMGDHLLVTDTYNDRVLRVSFDGDVLDQRQAFGPFRLRRPHGITAGSSCFLLSTDTQALLKLHVDHKKMRLDKGVRNPRGLANTAPGHFSTACGLGISATALFVADTFNHRVQIFDHDLKALGFFGEFGHRHGTGKFAYPVGVAVWHEWVVVADEHNQRLQLWRVDVSQGGVVAESLVDDLVGDVVSQPFGVTFSRTGRLFVTDRMGGKVFDIDFQKMLKTYGI